MRVFINNHDMLTWPRAMADHLAAREHEVIFLDNGSTYEPLLRWYEEAKYKVIHLGGNMGHKALWVTGMALREREPFCYTDPDLDISSVPDDWPEVLMRGVRATGKKCGFSLDDTFIPRENPAWDLDKRSRPEQWRHPFRIGGTTYYRHPIDTTFALYPAGAGFAINGCRVGRPYTARHLPWHIVSPETEMGGKNVLMIALNDELFHYYHNADPCSITSGRLRKMLSSYVR